MKELMDDSQADVLSEESWQDQVPSPGHEPHYERDEEEARVFASLHAADTLGYIGLSDTGEAIDANVPEGYFQWRWHGKQSIKRQIRKFLITGWCKWRGRRAGPHVRPADHRRHRKDSARMERYWTKREHGTQADEKHQDRSNNAAQVHTAQHWSERVQEIIQQFSWCFVTVILGTRMSRRKALKDGEVKRSNTLAVYKIH